MINFVESEFRCKCGCGKYNIKPNALRKLEMARLDAGVPFIITSGSRCEAHNKAEGGKPTSSHLNGTAFDIKATTSSQRFIILNALISAGFKRVGIAKTFIHCDVDPNKTDEVCWTY